MSKSKNITTKLTKDHIKKIENLSQFIQDNFKLLTEFDNFKDQVIDRILGIVGHDHCNKHCVPNYLCDCYEVIEVEIENCKHLRHGTSEHNDLLGCSFFPNKKNKLPAPLLNHLSEIMGVFYNVLAEPDEAFRVVDNNVLVPFRKIHYENLDIDAHFLREYLPEKFDYYDEDFRKLRLQVFLRDGEICAFCGARPGPDLSLTIDHIKPVSKFPELAMDLSNLQVLCWDCNLEKSDKIVSAKDMRSRQASELSRKKEKENEKENDSLVKKSFFDSLLEQLN